MFNIWERSEFELDEYEKKSYRCSSPITDQLKNSITTSSNADETANIINLVDNKNILKENKNVSSDNSIITIKGKKPCARYGWMRGLKNRGKGVIEKEF